MNEVIQNLNSRIRTIEGDVAEGLYEAGLKIQRSAQERTPVDTGNLRASAYTRRNLTGGIGVEVGYTASYAASVHESSGTLKGQSRADFGSTRAGVGFGGGTGKGAYWDSGEPKFLQRAIEENLDAIVRIVQVRAKVE